MNRIHLFFLGGVMLLLLGMSADVYAQAGPVNASSELNQGVLADIRDASKAWAPTLLNYARNVFWALALIEFIWALSPLVFKQADLGEIAGDLVRVVMTIGLFAFLLESSTTLMLAVTDSLQTAAANASGGGKELRPGLVLQRGIELADAIADTPVPVGGLTDAMTALPKMLGFMIAAIVLLLCFGFIAAFIAATLVESWIIIYGGVIFMGFGGARWTREIATTVVRYALAVGAKLFVMVLIVNLISDLTLKWTQDYKAAPVDTSAWAVVALAAICVYLVKTIPDLLQGMISGTSLGSGNALGGMAAGAVAGAAATAAAIKTAGASAALGSASGGGLSSSLQKSLAGGGERAAQSMATRQAGTGAGGGLTPAFAGGGATGAPGAGARIGGGGSHAFQSAGPQGGSNLAGRTEAGAPGGAASPAAPAGSQISGDFQQRAAKAMEGLRVPGMDTTTSPASTSETPSFGSGDSPTAPQQEPASKTMGVEILGAASEGLTRSFGSLASIAVPGMEQAPGLSGMTGPAIANDGETPDLSPSAEQNIIRPAPAPDERPPAASPSRDKGDKS